jgi:putative ABC transport system permease protein
MVNFLQDIRFGARWSIRNPTFSLAMLTTLAVSLGVNSAIFSLVNVVFLKPPAYPAADRLFVIGSRASHESPPEFSLYPPTIADEIRQGTGAFSSLSTYIGGAEISFDIAGAGYPERVQGAVVSAGFFETLGVTTMAGRLFSPEEDTPGRDQVAVLSEAVWRRKFDSDRGIAGKTLRLNGRTYTIVGVVSEGVDLPAGAQIWVPDVLQADKALGSVLPITYSVNVLARLKPGVSRQRAQAELDALSGHLGGGVSNGGPPPTSLELSGLQAQLYAAIKPALTLLWVAALLVLAIAGANVAGLVVAQAASRAPEMAVRAALGATRARLGRQMLTESLVLSVAGGGLGLLLSAWSLRVLASQAPPEIGDLNRVAPDGLVVAATFAAALAIGAIAALEASRRFSAAGVSQWLKEGAMSSTATSASRFSARLLVVSQITLALVLLIGSGLVTRSFRNLVEVDPGFDPKNVLAMRLSPPATRYPSRQRLNQLDQQVLDGIRSAPGVDLAAWASSLPTDQAGFEVIFSTNRSPAPESAERWMTDCVAVTPDYFAALRVPLLAGRWFSDQDNPASGKVVIVDQMMASQFWPNQSPVGEKVNWQGTWREICGVAGNTRQAGPAGRFVPHMYVPEAQFDFPWPYSQFLVRWKSGAAPSSAVLTQAVHDQDAELPAGEIRSLEDVISASCSRQRFTMLLFLVFAFLSLALATVGVYGVTAYSVAQRTRELGIRMALGATKSDVLVLVLRHGFLLLGCGISIGLGLSIALSRFLSSFLFSVKPIDAATFGGASLLLVAVGVLACYLPARNAARLDPLKALRSE